jgi:hypothetical protein
VVVVSSDGVGEATVVRINVSTHRAQVMAFSATYTSQVLSKLQERMHAPQHINLCEDTVSLEAICQFYHVVPSAQQSAQVRAREALRGFAGSPTADELEVYTAPPCVHHHITRPHGPHTPTRATSQYRTPPACPSGRATQRAWSALFSPLCFHGSEGDPAMRLRPP